MALTESQIYQLNMLTYAGFDGESQQIMGDAAKNLMQNAVRTGETVGSYVQKLQQAYGSEATKYQATFDSILSDPVLSNMSISGYDQMKNSGANMIVFTSDSTSEAVVAFEGSQSAGDWRDNFDGIGQTSQEDGVSTAYQQAALDFVRNDMSSVLLQYDSVITTGHSKGGNNAAYVTLLDNSIDRCVTFDAPGFSDDFVRHYEDKIAYQQDKIDNYCADSDYVNILQNCIGKQHYIEMNIPEGYQSCIDGLDMPALLLSHDPVMIQDYFYSGAPEVQRDPGMTAFHDMVNSYLRYASPENAKKVGTFLGDLCARLFYEKNRSGVEFLFKHCSNLGALAEMLTFVTHYLDENPDQTELILGVLDRFHPDLVKTLKDIYNDPVIRGLIKGYNFIVDRFIKDGRQNGKDLVVESRTRHDRIVMDTEVLRSLRRKMGELCNELSACCHTVISAADTCDSVNFLMTLDMTFRFFLRSRGKLHGTPERVLRNMALTLKGCCGDVEDLASAMNKLDVLITDCETDNRDRCLALNHGERAKYA